MDKFKFDEKERGNIHGIVPREGELYDWQVDNVIDAIETLISSRADGWVRVEDGLPDEGVPVLVFMSYGKTDVCHLRGNYWVQSVRPEHSNGSVTHWQPLPQPPKTAQQ